MTARTDDVSSTLGRNLVKPIIAGLVAGGMDYGFYCNNKLADLASLLSTLSIILWSQLIGLRYM